MIDASLPLPPSANRIWRALSTRGGRKPKVVKSEEYSAWLTRAGWELNAQRVGRVAGRYALTLDLPESMPGDIDNRVKALCDLLVAHAVIEDDRLAARIVIERVAGVSAGRCRVRVQPFPNVVARAGVGAARSPGVGNGVGAEASSAR